MKKKVLIASIIIIVIGGISSAVFVFVGKGTGVSGDLSVPLNLEGASNIGSISLELTYDPSVIEIVNIKPGDLAGNAMMEYNMENSGRVILGLIDSSGMNGNGSLVDFEIDVITEDQTTSLILGDVQAHDANTLIDITYEAMDGSLNSAGIAISPPVIRFAD